MTRLSGLTNTIREDVIRDEQVCFKKDQKPRNQLLRNCKHLITIQGVWIWITFLGRRGGGDFRSSTYLDFLCNWITENLARMLFFHFFSLYSLKKNCSQPLQQIHHCFEYFLSILEFSRQINNSFATSFLSMTWIMDQKQDQDDAKYVL